MLILSRRTDQRLVIGDNIEITVVELKDGHVRLGITAPKNVPVHRKELLDQIAAENMEAAASASLPDASAGSDAVEPRPTAAQASMLERLSAGGTDGK
jgi:carbon storage regulator